MNSPIGVQSFSFVRRRFQSWRFGLQRF